MPRSFQIVEDKIEEAEFFLRKLDFHTADLSQFDIRDSLFYLSAFLSAARSITFCLQASLRDLDGFSDWYHEQQDRLKESELAQFFVEARNLSQKVGYYPLAGGHLPLGEDGLHHLRLFFDHQPAEDLKNVPDTDVVTACEAYFKLLLEIVADCYKRFGRIIDPEEYYTLENMTEMGMTVEDFENEVGLESEGINTAGLSLEDRIGIVRAYAPKITIDWVFRKYLETDRYGYPTDKEVNE